MSIQKPTLLQRTVNTIADIYGIRGGAKRVNVAPSTFTRIRNGTIKNPDDETLKKLGLERIPGLEIHRRLR